MPAKSTSQQRLFGMIHACQKYGKCASKNIEDKSKEISPKAAEDFAKTSHKKLPEKKHENIFSKWFSQRKLQD